MKKLTRARLDAAQVVCTEQEKDLLALLFAGWPVRAAARQLKISRDVARRRIDRAAARIDEYLEKKEAA